MGLRVLIAPALGFRAVKMRREDTGARQADATYPKAKWDVAEAVHSCAMTSRDR